MRAYERFLRYIHFDSASDENNSSCPSTPGQKVLGEALVKELLALGISDARMDKNGYVYASIPANAEGDSIGLIAHMDTVNEVPCMPMNEEIIRDYNGESIVLKNGLTIDVTQFPSLKKYQGKSMIVTDGNTILGADDKAGVAEIMTMAERLMNDPSILHSKVCIGFTPDEEIGRGADLFDVASFGADYAYTVDGGEVGGIEYENFNAASGTVKVHGISIHPGSAKNIMKNAALIANEFISMLPATEIPACTSGYEGFFHLTEMRGACEEAQVDYIIRDHDRANFERRKDLFKKTADFLNEKYGEGTVECFVKDSYYNMKECLVDHPEVLAKAEKGYRAMGIEPVYEPIRGGTDGARLSYMGLPCPNISTGGMNGHGRKECICIEEMDKMVDVLTEIIRI